MKFILILTTFIPTIAFGLNINLKKNNGYADIVVSGITLPSEKLKKDLKSGLPTTFLATLLLYKNDKLLSKSSIPYKVYYDLWDEVYYYQSIINENKVNKKISSIEDLLEKIGSVNFEKALTINDLESEIDIKISLVQDPISKEKKLKVKKWLAENQVNLPNSGATNAPNAPSEQLSADYQGKGLFNKILNSELGDAAESGEWIYNSPLTKISKEQLK